MCVAKDMPSRIWRGSGSGASKLGVRERGPQVGLPAALASSERAPSRPASSASIRASMDRNGAASRPARPAAAARSNSRPPSASATPTRSPRPVR